MWEWERTLELKLLQSRLCKKQLWIPSVVRVRPTRPLTGLLLEVAGLGAFSKLVLVSTPEYGMIVPKGNRRPLTKLGEQPYRHTAYPGRLA